MPIWTSDEANGTHDIIATGGNYSLHGVMDRPNHFITGSGFNVINGGNAGDTISLGGNDTVFAGNGYNDIYARGGTDSIYGGQGNDWIHVGTGKDIMYGHDGENFFDFSGTSHTGLTTNTADFIGDFRQDDTATDMIVTTQSVFDRGVHVIDSNSTTSIEQAEHLAQTSDIGHDYGAVYVANHATGYGYLLMDNNNNHHFDTGVVMAGAAHNISDHTAATNMLLPH